MIWLQLMGMMLFSTVIRTSYKKSTELESFIEDEILFGDYSLDDIEGIFHISTILLDMISSSNEKIVEVGLHTEVHVEKVCLTALKKEIRNRGLFEAFLLNKTCQVSITEWVTSEKNLMFQQWSCAKPWVYSILSPQQLNIWWSEDSHGLFPCLVS